MQNGFYQNLLRFFNSLGLTQPKLKSEYSLTRSQTRLFFRKYTYKTFTLIYFFNIANLSSHVTESSRLIGYAVALSGAVVQSLTFVMVRKVGGSVSFYTNVFYFGWCSALLSGLTMFVFQKPVIPDCGTTRWFLIGVGRDAISFQISKEEIMILKNSLDKLSLLGFIARYLWGLLSFLNHK